MNALIYYWVLVIAFCIVMYVILDGFTLGVGILLPFLPQNEQDLAMSVVLPTWDGNQTWLVLGSAALYGAFTKAFAELLPILYIPLLVMVLALLFRGVSFEFRLKDVAHKRLWTNVFFTSSIIATLSQGVILGSFVQGYLGNDALDDLYHMTLSPFTALTGISLLLGYCLLGSTRLIKKSMGQTRQHMYRVATYLVWIVAIMMALISLWTPSVHPEVTERWFEHRNWLYLSWLPIITICVFARMLWRLKKQNNDSSPFWCTVILFICPYIGFLISIYPFIVPYETTIQQAASPYSTLLFLSVGITILLPTLIFYTIYSYRVFKGKVKETITY